MKLKFDDPQALAEKIRQYFDSLPDYEDPKLSRPPTLSGLALALGTTRQTLCEYINSAKDEGTTVKAQCGRLLVMAKARIEADLEERLVKDYNRGLEFVLSNGYAGWANKQSVKVEAEAEVKGEVKGEVKVKEVAAELSDEELLERIRVLKERAEQIAARESEA